MNFYPPHISTLLKFYGAFAWRYLSAVLVLSVVLTFLFQYMSHSLLQVGIPLDKLAGILLLCALPVGVVIFWRITHKGYKTFEVTWFKGAPRSPWQRQFLLPVLVYAIACDIIDWVIMTPLTSNWGLQVLGDMVLDATLLYILQGYNLLPFSLTPRERGKVSTVS